MRAVSQVKLVVLSALLLITALMVHGHSGESAEIFAKKPLQQVFGRVGSGGFNQDIPMDASIVEALKLDDYLFRTFVRGKGAVNLYIGYYRTAKKVGAAHDPLVCFTGQGWQINNREQGEYQLIRSPGLKISYSSIIAERQGNRELLVYWFQANGKATATTQSQKIAMVWDKFSGRNGDNSFVRISTPLNDESPEIVRRRLFDFIEDFYPVFYRYVTKNDEREER